MKYLIIPFLLLFISCSNVFTNEQDTPSSVTSDKVQNNSEGIMEYNGKPFSGKVQDDEKGYMIVKDGVITHMIICHNNGSTAIDFNLHNQTTSLFDEKGNQISKEEFLRKYPYFQQMSDAWGELKRLN
ncbi:MAG: hypothetical protein K2L14_02915 [Duncaniella sp.]|nr:hypothetical protein [Duncaniella sp.]